MTEIASIVSALASLSNSIDAAAKQFIATVEANPAAFTQVQATAVDLKVLADHTVRHTDLVREVAGRINMRTLAEEFGTSDIADEISLSDLANEISTSDIASEISTSDVAAEIDLSELADKINTRDIADEIDLSDLRDKCVEAMSSDIDTEEMQENIAREVAENVDAASIAQELDMGDVVRELVDEIDMDDLASRLMSDTHARDAVVAELSKNPCFIAAVAVEMAQMMLRGSKEQEPHGSRDTFVPASEGPSPEQFNTLQD